MAEKIEAKTEEQIKEETFDARSGITADFLDGYKLSDMKRLQREAPDKAEDLEKAIVSLSSGEKDMGLASDIVAKIIESQADYLSGDKRNWPNFMVGGRDAMIIDYLGDTMDAAEEKADEGLDILGHKELDVFEKYLNACAAKTEDDDIRKAIDEIKEKVAAAKVKPEKEALEAEETTERDFEREMREELVAETEEKFFEKYGEGTEISQESRNIIGNVINSELEDVYRHFVSKWVKDNKDALGAEGISIKGDENAQFEFVWKNLRQRALHDLENNPDYEEYLLKRGRGLDLLKDSQKDYIPPETQFLLINNFNKQAGILRKRMEGMPEGSKERIEIQANLDAIFKVQKELAEKINGGKKLETLAEEELRAKNDPDDKIIAVSKEEYIKSLMDTHLKLKTENYPPAELIKKYDDLIEKSNLSAKLKEELKGIRVTEIVNVSTWPRNLPMSKEEVAIALSMGIDVSKMKTKGWLPFSSKVVVGDKVIADSAEDLTKKIAEGWKAFIEKAARDDITKMGEEAYENAKKSFEDKKTKLIQAEIDPLAQSSNKAEGGVAGVYERIRQRLVAEYLEGVITKQRPQTEKKAIQKEFSSKKRVNFTEFVDRVYNRTAEGFEDIDGSDIDGEMATISRFFSGYGVKASPERLKKTINPEEYKRAVRRKKGFLDYLLNLIIKQPWSAKKAA